TVPRLDTQEAQDQANREAIPTGSSPPPVDVSATGNTAGFVPQAGPSAPQKSALDRAGGIALGFVEEYGDTALDIAKTGYLNILTFGGYSVFKFFWNQYEGYKEGIKQGGGVSARIFGAANRLNPL